MNKHFSIQSLVKLTVMVGVGLSGGASALGASHSGHHSSGHASTAHRSHSGGSRSTSHASAAHRNQSTSSHHAGTAHSQPHGGSSAHRNGHAGSHRNYHLTNGRQFRGGYYYPGRNHRHWANTVFDARYGCTLYYDPDLACYYYWCQPDDCYYPVSYCPYNRYVWTTVTNERSNDDDRQLQTDLDDLSAKLDGRAAK